MDNGIGMYPEQVKEINKALESYRETTAMGLGLAIVSMVVHEHKGSISLTSKLDEGTDVKIILNIYKGNNMSEKDYAETLHLPKTSFQMKGNLPNKEPNYIKNGKSIKFMKKDWQRERKVLFCTTDRLMPMEIHILDML